MVNYPHLFLICSLLTTQNLVYLIVKCYPLNDRNIVTARVQTFESIHSTVMLYSRLKSSDLFVLKM